MKTTYRFFALLSALLFFAGGNAFGADITLTSRLQGSAMYNGYLKMQDEDFGQLTATPAVLKDVYSYGFVKLGTSELPGLALISSAGLTTFSVDLEVTQYKNDNTLFAVTTPSLTITYSEGSVMTTDLDELRLTGHCHKFTVKVKSVKRNGILISGASGVPNFLFLETGFRAERYYVMNVNTQLTATHKLVTYTDGGGVLYTTGSAGDNTDDIEINWGYITGAEAYELEWTWLDNYKLETGVLGMNEVDLSDYDFEHNSTRIHTSNHTYRIPRTFSKGYLVYRVRAVGRWQTSLTKDLYGAWSSPLTPKLKVQDWGANVVAITAEHAGTLNWQYQSTYAENGKKKEVTQYYDGTLRGRQTVTRINSTNQSVVGETFYDNEGRGVIQVLPVPQQNPAIKYYGQLSLNDDQQKYSQKDIDWGTDDCVVAGAGPMDESAGASRYYNSETHAQESDWQQYVPDANGFPFTQVEYMPDNTGRVAKQTGVGDQHQIGTGHETKYFYSHPDQKELDRLFGYKVGLSSRYTKTMVVDANGQVSISYTDPQGRVVATSLAGSNITPFESLQSEQQSADHQVMTADVLNKLVSTDHDTPADKNYQGSTGAFGAWNDKLTAGQPVNVVETGVFTFHYDVSADVFDASCEGYDMHYPFVYDVAISLIDKCGDTIFDTLTQVGAFQINGLNGGSFDVTTEDVTLQQGVYMLQKSITINPESLQAYRTHYLLPSNPCILSEGAFAEAVDISCGTTCAECAADLGTLAAFLAQAKTDLGVTALTPAQDTIYTALWNQLLDACNEPCKPLTSCDVYRGMMVADLMPGGQYAGSPNDVLSIFNPGGNLRRNGTNTACNWRNLVYYDEFGMPDKISATFDGTSWSPALLPSAGTPSAPTSMLVNPNMLLNVSDFMSMFRPTWVESFLEYHPEYYLLAYAQPICTQTVEMEATSATTTAGLYLSSDAFDDIVKNKAFTYAQAQAVELTIDGINYYSLNLVDAPSLMAIDPYFNTTYALHNTTVTSINGTVLKNSIMSSGLSNYAQNQSMLEFSARIVLAMNDPSGGAASYPDNWEDLDDLCTDAQMDAIWNTYKSLYVSYKSKVNQYFMDLYGFKQTQQVASVFSECGSGTAGKFNGAIGAGSVNYGAVLGFQGNSQYSAMLQQVNSAYLHTTTNATSNGSCTLQMPPIVFAGPEYNSKQIRFVRTDALQNNNSGFSGDAFIAETAAEADYAQWEQTGICPAVKDMEVLLNGLGTRGQLTGNNNTMGNTPELVADIFYKMSGISTITSGSYMNISPVVSGSSLELTFTTTTTSESITLGQVGSLSWGNYGDGSSNWHIYTVKHSYAVPGTNDVQLIIKAGLTPETAQEYVVSYTSTVNLNDCQAAFAASNANDPDCDRKEQFEAALLALAQRLQTEFTVQNGQTIMKVESETPVPLSNYTEFTQTILTEYLPGLNPVWRKETASVAGTYHIYKLETSTSTLHLSFDFSLPGLQNLKLQEYSDYPMSGTYVEADYYNSSSNTIEHEVANSNIGLITNGFSVKKIDFSCSCLEMQLATNDLPPVDNIETTLLNLMNYLNTNLVPNGTSLPQVNALAPYLSCNAPDLKVFNLVRANGVLSFTLATSATAPGCAFSFNTPGPGNTNPYQYNSVTLEWDHTCSVNAIFESGVNAYFPATVSSIVLPEVECDNCSPQPEAPISCNTAYASYTAFMFDQFDYTASDTLFVQEYLLSEADFCANELAYVSAAYADYLTELDITDINDPDYISISNFSATLLGYSNTKLSAAVDAYATYLNGTAETFAGWRDFVNGIYLPAHPEICPAPSPPGVFPDGGTLPCDQWETNVAVVNQQSGYAEYLEQISAAFTQEYLENGLASLVEHFTYEHPDKEYQYTLYYYDRGGNLVQTVPPAGVNRLKPGTGNVVSYDALALIRSTEPNKLATTESGQQKAPEHSLKTTYNYNSLNQLTAQKTPDGGASSFAYDKLGRIVASQNALQGAEGKFSYTCYDGLGRVIEAGEFKQTGDYVLFIDGNGKLKQLVAAPQNPFVNVDDAMWINNVSNISRSQVTRSIYDGLGNAHVTIMSGSTQVTDLASSQFVNYSPGNTRNRICGVIYQETYNASIDVYNSAMYYDYDIHGNVKELLQVNMDAGLVALNQHIKRVAYQYDLVSGNVNKTYYQKGYKDQFVHRYQYDADNRVTVAETSPDDLNFEKDSKYFYYDHGPLARTETGERKVQSEDFAYTIQGWIKAVNGEQSDYANNMGADGKTGTANFFNGRDAFGYSLSYYNNDYASANTTMLPYSGSTAGALQPATNLYNGNIRAMYTSLSNTGEVAMRTHRTRYTYDQLNRIKSMTGSYATNPAAPAFAASQYNSTYAFDPNGNLLTMTNSFDNNGLSTSGAAVNVAMDNFSYKYLQADNTLYTATQTGQAPANATNRLSRVDDGIINPVANDMGDQADNNYSYDAIGQLTKDAVNGINTITWNVQNKVKTITKSDGSTISFAYGPMGQRISKTVVNSTGTVKTFYGLDASGNPMSTYKSTGTGANFSLYLDDRNLYGSKRVGIENVDLQMTKDNLTSYMALSPVQLAGSDNICLVSDKWGFENPGGLTVSTAVSDYNTDGYEDLRFTYPTGGFSASQGKDLIPGALYTLEFDYLSKTNIGDLTIDVRDCATSTSLVSPVFQPGHVTVSFTAPSSGKVRIKWLANAVSPSASTNFTISKVKLRYQGQDASPLIASVKNMIGDKNYELSNHLGNVLQTVTDRKLPLFADVDEDQFRGYTADVVSFSDYYPYGAQLPKRFGGDADYRYGFNGIEEDDEVKSDGNSLDFGARMLDPRLGRWLTIDPLASRFPMQSPYAFANNSPVVYNDPTGKSGELTIATDANGNPTGYVIKANLHFYTGNKALAKFDHNRVKNEMMEQFNSQGLTMTVDGKTLPVTLDLTSDLTYSNSFNSISYDPNSTNWEANTLAKQALPGNNTDFNDLVNNYIRLEDLPIDDASFNNVGRQIGMWNVNQLYKGSTTALHEFMHSLGVDHPTLKNAKGQITAYDTTTDAQPGQPVPLSYPRGTTYAGTEIQINPDDRRPSILETANFIMGKQTMGGQTYSVLGDTGFSGQILIDKKGNSEYLEHK